MNSVEHAAIGAVVAGLGCLAHAEVYPPAALAALFVGGVGLSVFIDLDHFLLARLSAGDWSHLRRALSRPGRAFTAPAFIFPDVQFGPVRLASHVLIGLVLAGGALVVDYRLAAFVVAVVGAHVVADVLRDARLA